MSVGDFIKGLFKIQILTVRAEKNAFLMKRMIMQ